MFKRCILLALLFCAPIWADPNISVPASVPGLPGAFIQVPATTKGEIVRWVAVDPGLNLFPSDLLKDTKTAVVSSVNPGKYRLLAYTSIGNVPSEAVFCVVVVGNPTPPIPPPDPSDPFFAEIKKLYEASEEAAEFKRQVAKQLIVLYKYGVEQANDPNNVNIGMWALAMKNKSEEVGMGLQGLRAYLGSFMRPILGSNPNAEFNDELRKKAIAACNKIIKALEDVSK